MKLLENAVEIGLKNLLERNYKDIYQTIKEDLIQFSQSLRIN